MLGALGRRAPILPALGIFVLLCASCTVAQSLDEGGSGIDADNATEILPSIPSPSPSSSPSSSPSVSVSASPLFMLDRDPLFATLVDQLANPETETPTASVCAIAGVMCRVMNRTLNQPVVVYVQPCRAPSVFGAPLWQPAV
jgi:hypothetical protein